MTINFHSVKNYGSCNNNNNPKTIKFEIIQTLYVAINFKIIIINTFQ